MSKVIPAILTDDPVKLEKMVRTLEKMADEVHVDFMDGEFVETISIPPQALIACQPKIPVEAHLMVKRPDLFVAPFKETMVQRIIFHVDAVDNSDFLFRLFRDEGFGVGIALNPETSLDAFVQHLPEVDFIHFLTVHPGKQGNPFQEQVLKKIRSLRESWSLGTISVDGGVNKENIDAVVAAGADRVVVGSTLWQSANPGKLFEELKRQA